MLWTEHQKGNFTVWPAVCTLHFPASGSQPLPLPVRALPLQPPLLLLLSLHVQGLIPPLLPFRDVKV